jgi:hypothetical protein
MRRGPPMPINRAEFHARGFGLVERGGYFIPGTRSRAEGDGRSAANRMVA